MIEDYAAAVADTVVLTLDGLAWVASDSPELARLVALLRYLLARYEDAPTVPVPTDEVADALQTSVVELVLLDQFFWPEPLGARLSNDKRLFEVTRPILQWDGVGSVDSFLARRRELSRKDEWAGMTGLLGEVSLSTRLRGLWEDARRAEKSADRGRALEDFCEAFFATCFRVVDRNLRTDTEEFDLVVEPTSETDGRFDFELPLLVEAKNWKAPVDQNVVSAMAGKLVTRQLRQAFILTTGSFTRDAIGQAEHARGQNIDIVLLDAERVKLVLDGSATPNQVLRRAHLDLVLRRRRSGTPSTKT